jgi:SAM-dependent methyltransferase
MDNPRTSDFELLYLSGARLYGDDFTTDGLRAWYEAEQEGYASTLASNVNSYAYPYHALNVQHLFRKTQILPGTRAIGLGSAYGDEFMPIIGRLSSITIIDPSEEFASNSRVSGCAVTYRKPRLDGSLDFPDAHFNLATSFGALHHIANVSAVVRELYRCLTPGGHLLLREPIVTQGDWRQPRRGLTKYERGIPEPLLIEIVEGAGFLVEHQTLCEFAPLARAMSLLGQKTFRRPWSTVLDQYLCRLFSFNIKYHRRTLLEKFGPSSIALVLKKP